MGFGVFRLILVSLLFLNISNGFVTSGFYVTSLLMLKFLTLSYLYCSYLLAYLNLKKHLHHVMICPRYRHTANGFET